jgi:hypothetical protein
MKASLYSTHASMPLILDIEVVTRKTLAGVRDIGT